MKHASLLVMLLVVLALLAGCAAPAAPPTAPTQTVQPPAPPPEQASSPRSLPPTYTPTVRIVPTLRPSSTPYAVREAPSDITGFDGPLSVVIFYPVEDAVVYSDYVQVTGEANPGTVVEINGEAVLVGDEMLFVIDVPLEEGLNVLEITASDDDENQETMYLPVSYEPPQ